MIQGTLQRDMRLAQFVHLRRVDIHMDDFGVRREGIEFSGHTVIEACADRNQQVARLHGQIGRFRTVHAQHPHIAGIIGGHRAQSF